MRLVPSTTFTLWAPTDEADAAGDADPSQLVNVSTDELFAGKRVVVFALPTAFGPTCSTRHLPRYEELYDEFKMLGVDEVYGLSVNDPFVMYEWGKALGIDKVRLLPDGNGEFTRKMGMLVEKGNQSCGLRSWRYAMFVEDNSSIDPLEFTDADSMLNFMQTWREPLP